MIGKWNTEFSYMNGLLIIVIALWIRTSRIISLYSLWAWATGGFAHILRGKFQAIQVSWPMWTIIGQTDISLFRTFSAKPNNDCLIRQSLQWYVRLTKVSASFNNRCHHRYSWTGVCRLLEHVRSGGSAFLRVGKEKCIKITLCTNFRVSRYIFVAKKRS